MTYPLVFVLGPTGSGKSGQAERLARAFKGAVLNGDSVKLYAGLKISSAQPEWGSPPVRRFLFEALQPPEQATAGDFQRLALPILRAELKKGPVFVPSGSGFYIQALEKGLPPIAPAPAGFMRALRREIEEKGPAALYQELADRDPEKAGKTSPKDSFRILRALSVARREGRPISAIQKEHGVRKLPWRYKKIGLQISKEELRKRLERRSLDMVRRGIVEEAEALLKRGFASWRPLQSIGCREALLCLKGEISLRELPARITLSAMRLAKKQRTWFRKDRDIIWRPFQEDLRAALRPYIEGGQEAL